jgi:dienelactone hydrolase
MAHRDAIRFPRTAPRLHPARRHFAWWMVAGLALSATGGAAAAIVEEAVMLPVTIQHQERGEVRHDLPVMVFRDDTRTRAPFVVLGHGRATTPAANAALGQARYTANSRYLVALGFTVFVPTRIGYGVAGGPDLEFSGDCQAKRYSVGYDAAAQQTRAVVAYARGRRDIDAAMGLVMGQSYGGTTAIAIAADPPDGVRAAVNFAGGGGGRPTTHPGQPCSPMALTHLFAGYGATARIPTLWLYAPNDRYMGERLPRDWFDAFLRAGGAGRFVALPAHGEDGHASFTRNTDAWRPAFETFLRASGFQLAR